MSGRENKSFLSLLILSSLCEIFAGAIYVWSAFASILKDEFNLTHDIANFIFSLSHVSFSIGMLEGGLLVSKHGLDRILVSASILHLLGFTFSSLATNIWIIALSYGIIFGLACGIINSSVISTVIRHSRGAHGKASGIILMSFGLSPFVLTPIIGFINSVLSWRGVFIVIGILGFTTIFSVAILLKVQGLIERRVLSKDEGTSKRNKSFSIRLKKMFSSRFWIVEAWYVPLLSAGVAILGNLMQFLIENNVPFEIALLCLSIYGLTNAFGRSIFGYIHDTLYGKYVACLNSFLMLLSLTLLLFSVHISSIGSIIIAILLVGLCHGGSIPLSFSFITDFFSGEDVSYLIGFNGTISMSFSGIIGPLVIGFLREKTGDYNLCMYYLYILLLVSCAFSYLITKIKTSSYFLANQK